MEDIQQADAQEQVEKTTLDFGHGNNDTQAVDNGQVEQAEQEVLNWQNDKRYAEHWKEDPNAMYSSLKYTEKRQSDFDNQINEYKEQVGGLNKYKEDYEALEKLFDDPNIGTELLNVINRKGNNQETQATGQPDPMQTQMQEMMQWKSNLEDQANTYRMNQQQANQLSEIDKFADQYNINYNKDDFTAAMHKNNVDPSNWVHFFKSQATDIAMKNASNRAAESALQNKASIPGTLPNSSKAQNGPTGLSMREELMGILQ
tara:strand:- start:1743 stop:2519 length:777 start_codon:yes stop_codon:yes gene_type:complete